MWERFNAFNRANSRQGFSPGYRIMDVKERVVYEDEPQWERALADPKSMYPKTTAAIACMEPRMAAQYHRFLVKGIKLGHKEFLKLYAYQSEPKYLVLSLFCRDKSGACMRAIAAALSQLVPHFNGAAFLLPQEREDDRFYQRLLRTEAAKAELHDYWLLWGLDNPLLLPDLVALSMNEEGSQLGDTLTNDFVHGRTLLILFEHLCFALASLATTCVIVELLYSQMKNIQEANQTSESVDEELMFFFNVLKEDRQLRREMLAHNKNGGGSRHVHTKEQIAKLCEQALDSLTRYSTEAMKGVPGRRHFECALTKADDEQAMHCCEVKSDKKAKSKAAAETDADLVVRQQAAHTAPLAVELAEAALLAITRGQRLFAVVMEEKITGQVNREAAFWSKIPGGVAGLTAEVRAMLPIVASIIGRLEEFRNESLPKADIVVKTVVVKRWKELLVEERTTKPSGFKTSGLRWADKEQQQVSRTAAVHPNAQAVQGLQSTVKSLRSFFLARESPWNPGTGPVMGQVLCASGEVRRGFACSRCLLDPNFATSSPPAPPVRLQHWGSVACFLSPGELRQAGHLLFMQRRTGGDLRCQCGCHPPRGRIATLVHQIYQLSSGLGSEPQCPWRVRW
jgi:hypothetical protein